VGGVAHSDLWCRTPARGHDHRSGDDRCVTGRGCVLGGTSDHLPGLRKRVPAHFNDHLVRFGNVQTVLNLG
jgi:hypothetical protein